METLTDTTYQQQLIDKIEAKTARVAIVGMGYVGLPLAVCMGKVGFTVTGVDLSASKIEQINRGSSYIDDVSDEELASLVNQGLIQGQVGFDGLETADIVIICVPTPLTKNRDPDISYILQVTEQVAKHLRSGQLITLESTTYPGTTEEVMLPLLAKSGLKVGEDYFLAHSPERVDPGNARYTTHNTNKVVGGFTPACTEVAAAFYGKSILHIVSVSSPGAAEMVKVFENTFRAVNIALVNELALLCDKMGLNVWEVVEAAGTKPFGMMTFWPGPGVGGHCIPIDPFYLTWKAREYNFHTRFIELAGEINDAMPHFVREKLIRALGKQGKPLYGAKVLMLGVAYKANLADWRKSPAMDLLEVLKQDGVDLYYHDPHVSQIEDASGQHWYSKSLSTELLRSMDCVALITNHKGVDYDLVLEQAPVIVDTRNAFKDIQDNRRAKIELL